MSTPLVRCGACAREWHSATLAEGLREMDGCPRCGGTLEFSDTAPEAHTGVDAPAAGSETAPHLVLGVPRR